MIATHATEIGRRENNEDSLLVASELGVFAVADGLGGHAGGEAASRLAVDAIRDVFTARPRGQRVETTLREALETANDRILTTSLRPTFARLRGMGTTIVALACDAERKRGIVGWSGDSRCYRLRSGALALVTRDHVVVKPLLHRCLGTTPGEAGDLREVDLRPGDVMLLCSDGLTDTLEDRDIERILDRGGDARALVAATLARRERRQDNVSVVVVRV